MKVIAVKKIENCLSGKNVWDLELSNVIGERFLAHLSKLGKLSIHQFKPKPYFTIIVRGQYTLKGSVGNRTMRLLLPDTAEKKVPDELIEFINYENGFTNS